MAGTIGHVKEFDSEMDCWTVYSERLEQYFTANQITDATIRVATLLSVIGDNTYKLLRDLCFPNLPKTKTFQQLSDIMKTHFSPPVSVFRERIIFHKAAQGTYESVSDWYARLRSLAVDCKFGDNLELILKDRFVVGLKPGAVQDRMCEEKETETVAKLVEIATKKEAMQQPNNGMVQWVQAKQRGNQKRRLQQQDRGMGGSQPKMIEKNGDRCECCGKKHFNGQICRYRTYKCRICLKQGHLAIMCKQKQILQLETSIDERAEIDSSSADIFVVSHLNINSVNIAKYYEPITARVKIRNSIVVMEVDSGAAVTIINHKTYEECFNDVTLKQTELKLRSYAGDIIKPLGYFKTAVKYRNQVKELCIYVVKSKGPNLLGRDFLHEFKLSLNVIGVKENESGRIQRLISKYRSVFDGRLGKFQLGKIKIEVKAEAKPTFCKPRQVPLAFKQKVEEELIKLEREGVITPTPTNEWGTALVPVMKPDGTIRLCGDYRTSVNKHLEEVKYPLPKIEEIFATLRGGQKFSKIDLSQAYAQFELEEESRKLLAWSTHKGIFLMNRMPYGIAPASAIFQKHLEVLLKPVEGAINFLDDILVTGTTEEEHLNRLEMVLNLLEKAGLKARLDKCEFFKDQVEYLGHRITQRGLEKTEKKIEAIAEAKRPENVTELRSFLGMVNYYNKYIPQAATILDPLYKLLQKEAQYQWNTDCERAFQHAKEEIISERILVHYNPELPLILYCDASEQGVGAALFHRLPNMEEKPIGFVSRKLLPQEKRYSVIHREALAIYFGVKRFQQYLLGRKFVLKTDHKPILALFGENKSIPQMYVTRMQRWAVFLLQFNYSLEYIKGTSNKIADYLSRSPIEAEKLEDDDNVRYLNFTAIQDWPIDNDVVAEETAKDITLQAVKRQLQNQWPEEITPEVMPYFRRREELTEENGCLLWGYRLIIPSSLRKRMLEELHTSHMGMGKTKSLARSYLWWPGLDQDIELTIKSCISCLKQRQEPPKDKDSRWQIPEEVWQRVHLDFLGPIKGREFLIIIDAKSKWPEVFTMRKSTTVATIDKLRETFARFGLPKLVVTDNGTAFVSRQMEEFFTKNGIKHLTTPPGHPASNGQAENGVKTFKAKIKAALLDPKNKDISIDTLIARFLINYRNMQHCTTKITPAQAMFKRKLRNRLDILKEANRPPQTKKEKGKFEKGELIMVRDYRNTNSKGWEKAKIQEEEGNKIYKCLLENGQIWRRHEDQIIARADGQGNERKTSAPPTFKKRKIGRHIETTGPSIPLERTEPTEPPVPPERTRPTRITKVPARFKD